MQYRIRSGVIEAERAYMVNEPYGKYRYEIMSDGASILMDAEYFEALFEPMVVKGE